MKPGTRALLLAAYVVTLGAVLSYLLDVPGPFMVAAGPTAFGKFVYDTVRDRKGE